MNPLRPSAEQRPKRQLLRDEQPDAPPPHVNNAASKARAIGSKIKGLGNWIKGPEPKKESSYSTEAVFRGRICTKTTATVPLSRWQRIGTAVGKVPITAFSVGVATLATLGNGFKEVVGLSTLKKFGNEALEGKKVRETFSYQSNPVERNARYNPKDKDSLKSFVKKNKNMLYESNGHYYFLDKGRSSIIMLPNLKSLSNEDIDANDEIRSLRFWDPDTGESITEATRLKATICSYLQIHNEIQDDAKEYAKKLTEDIRKDDPNADELPVVHYTDIVIDFNNRMIRGYINLQEDQPIHLYAPAKKIDIKKESWKEMISFFDSEKTKHRKKLGEKVRTEKKEMDEAHHDKAKKGSEVSLKKLAEDAQNRLSVPIIEEPPEIDLNENM